MDTIAPASFGMPQLLHSRLMRMELSNGKITMLKSGTGPLRGSDQPSRIAFPSASTNSIFRVMTVASHFDRVGEVSDVLQFKEGYK